MGSWKDFSSGGGAGGRTKHSCGSLAAEMRLGRSCANSGIIQPLPATSGKDWDYDFENLNLCLIQGYASEKVEGSIINSTEIKCPWPCWKYLGLCDEVSRSIGLINMWYSYLGSWCLTKPPRNELTDKLLTNFISHNHHKSISSCNSVGLLWVDASLKNPPCCAGMYGLCDLFFVRVDA